MHKKCAFFNLFTHNYFKYMLWLMVFQTTVVIILVLKIDHQGMKALEFIPKGMFLRFKQETDLGTIVPKAKSSAWIGGLPAEDFVMSGTHNNPVRVYIIRCFLRYKVGGVEYA